jgi:hypothetical protein
VYNQKGRLPDPAISAVLVAMVLRHEHDREALLALSVRQDRLATEFIRRAYNDMALTALVRSARLGLKSLPNRAGG